MKNNTALQSRLRTTARRLLLIGSAAALVWAIASAILLLLAGIWLDLLWELSPAARIAVLWIGAASGVAVVIGLIWRAACAASPAAMARRLDLAVNSGGQILTGHELEEGLDPISLVPGTGVPGASAGARHAPLTSGLSRMAADQAAALAGRAPISKAVPARPLVRSLGALGGIVGVVAMLALIMPRVARTEWDRFTSPQADVPPFSTVAITLTPPGKEVRYGEELEIKAMVEGGAVEHVELVLESEDGRETVLPMFPEADGSWRAVLAKVTESALYYARAYHARSEKHQLTVITVPTIESVRVQVKPPAYAGQSTYEGAVPEDGIKGLPGTTVTLFATSNRNLSGGQIVLRGVGGPPAKSGTGGAPAKDGRTTSHGKQDACTTITMTPSDSEIPEAVGQFVISGDAKFELRVIDKEEEISQQSVTGSITMLADQHPFVRIVQPQPISLATPDARLPVVLSAEDQEGISRIQLFRSLNESRPLPAQVLSSAADAPAPHRSTPKIDLPLEGYRLQPGDVIKLFARVEDNDPAGAKGAESQVVAVRIISQQEFERMLRVRQGMEVLASKYREAQRRMEGLSKETEGLRKKLQKFPPRSTVTKEAREEIQKLKRLMRRTAEDVRRSAAHKLPYDMDEKLSPQLDQIARMSEEMAKELEKLEKQLDLTSEQLEKKLQEMEKRLKDRQGEYQQQAMTPMEHMEAVFPLMVDQSRFVLLVMRQKDLAERMASLKGHDGEDNPALKARMRDLEHEQGQIREELDQLLNDIEDHATRLPSVQELEKLRETALKFAKDVRASGVSMVMSEAEDALAEFAGTRAHAKAKEAAEILEKFLNQCEGENGLEGQARGSLVFRPGMGRSMGATAAQMLAEMSMGMRSGMGAYGNMGLYGQMAGMSGMGSGQSGDPHTLHGGRGDQADSTSPGGGNPDQPGPGEVAPGGAATAAGEALVPARYRQQVGQYFQRLAEELGNRTSGRGKR